MCRLWPHQCCRQIQSPLLTCSCRGICTLLHLKPWCCKLLGGQEKYVGHAIGLVDVVGHVSEDGDEAFDELLAIFEQET